MGVISGKLDTKRGKIRSELFRASAPIGSMMSIGWGRRVCWYATKIREGRAVHSHRETYCSRAAHSESSSSVDGSALGNDWQVRSCNCPKSNEGGTKCSGYEGVVVRWVYGRRGDVRWVGMRFLNAGVNRELMVPASGARHRLHMCPRDEGSGQCHHGNQMVRRVTALQGFGQACRPVALPTGTPRRGKYARYTSKSVLSTMNSRG